MLLNSHLGILLYFLLPNHWVWRLLSEEEKKKILEGCQLHNNTQYAEPFDYDPALKRSMEAQDTREGKIIQHLLRKLSPRTVLEIGPGSGFYTRLFLDYPTVREYTAIDIVEAFIRHLKMRTDLRLGDKMNLIHGDFLKHDFNNKFDLVIFICSLHHIPNRVDFVSKCASILTEKGKVVFIEPRHAIPRILELIRKYIRDYHKKAFWFNKRDLCTHHFLTFSEIKHIARKSGLKIDELLFYFFRGERYLNQIKKTRIGFFSCYHFIPLALFSRSVYVMLKKN